MAQQSTVETHADIGRFLSGRMQQGKISSTSLIITLFGDVITQHGGEIWLGSLIRLLAPLDISERLVRTSVFRLVQDDWLQSDRDGRRSYYCFSETGHRYYRRAAERIYATTRPGWDHGWTIVIPAFVSEEMREPLRRGLLWQGFGQLAGGVFAIPSGERAALNELLAQLGQQESVVVLDASSNQSGPHDTLSRLVRERWNLDEIAALYAAFNQTWQGIPAALERHAGNAQNMLLLRVLLIHDYRRILLRDPELPAEMLPPHWQGNQAQTLVGQIYKKLAESSIAWVADELENREGAMPVATADFYRRFAP